MPMILSMFLCMYCMLCPCYFVKLMILFQVFLTARQAAISSALALIKSGSGTYEQALQMVDYSVFVNQWG